MTDPFAVCVRFHVTVDDAVHRLKFAEQISACVGRWSILAQLCGQIILTLFGRQLEREIVHLDIILDKVHHLPRADESMIHVGLTLQKPFAERSVRTLKYERLWLDPPENALIAEEMLDIYRMFYNTDRANQSLACGNRPPYEAFPELSALPHLPETVDPDALIQHYHSRIFRRRVDSSGQISVGNHQLIREHEIQDLVGRDMSFNEYASYILERARKEQD